MRDLTNIILRKEDHFIALGWCILVRDLVEYDSTMSQYSLNGKKSWRDPFLIEVFFASVPECCVFLSWSKLVGFPAYVLKIYFPEIFLYWLWKESDFRSFYIIFGTWEECHCSKIAAQNLFFQWIFLLFCKSGIAVGGINILETNGIESLLFVSVAGLREKYSVMIEIICTCFSHLSSIICNGRYRLAHHLYSCWTCHT